MKLSKLSINTYSKKQKQMKTNVKKKIHWFLNCKHCSLKTKSKSNLTVCNNWPFKYNSIYGVKMRIEL